MTSTGSRAARRPADLVVGPARHRARGVPDLRAAAAHPRHARDADGAQRRLPHRRCSSSRAGSQLETVNWVIRNLAGYVVFAIIVLFQADIRRALAHFGRAPFFRYFERAPSDDETHRGARGRGRRPVASRIGAHHRHRAADRPAQLHRGRHSARRDGHLRPAGQHLPAGFAAARRRGDRAGRPHRGRGVLPAAVRQSARQPRSGHAASRRARPDRGERRRGHRRVGGDRGHLAGDRRRPRARTRRRDAARRGCSRCSASPPPDASPRRRAEHGWPDGAVAASAIWASRSCRSRWRRCCGCSCPASRSSSGRCGSRWSSPTCRRSSNSSATRRRRGRARAGLVRRAEPHRRR